MRLLKVLWHIAKSAGPGMWAGRQADRLFRYYVLKVLGDIGLFRYLETPRTYGQIIAEFNFVDDTFTRELLTTLLNDRKNVVRQRNGQYLLNPAHAIPTLDQVLAKTDRRIRGFMLLAEGMTRHVLPRLRAETFGLAESFEMNGRQLLTKFDRVLGNSIYSAMREAAFAYLLPEERKWLRGKKLLDIGCGSGRETAELWLKFGGEVQITALDPVASMLELARNNFEVLLDELRPLHPPLTDGNHPQFKKASATRLPFADDTFDAAFWLFILHWTPDPRRAVAEAVRVVRPGGLIFGGQAFKPEVNPYFDLVLRTNQNCHGFFWREDYRAWFAEHGLEIDMVTAAGIHRVRNEPRKSLLEITADNNP